MHLPISLEWRRVQPFAASPWAGAATVSTLCHVFDFVTQLVALRDALRDAYCDSRAPLWLEAVLRWLPPGQDEQGQAQADEGAFATRYGQAEYSRGPSLRLSMELILSAIPQSLMGCLAALLA